jgi:hypothetical protein
VQTTSGPLLSLRTAAPSQKNSPATVSFVLHARHKKTEEFMLKGPGQEVILQMLFFAYRASIDIVVEYEPGNDVHIAHAVSLDPATVT